MLYIAWKLRSNHEQTKMHALKKTRKQQEILKLYKLVTIEAVARTI